jgi:hypothetical protein
LSNPHLVPFTQEVETILRPHISILTDLLSQPQRVSEEDAPVLGYVSAGRNGHAAEVSGIVSHVGSLSVLDRARVSNWFVRNVPNASNLLHEWIGRPPLAHAFTLVIASRAHAELVEKAETTGNLSQLQRKQMVLKYAWEKQRSEAGDLWHDVDVDAECLAIFEARIFETSKQAGLAGYYQWGLDAGDHQDAWNPYFGRPQDLCPGDAEGSDSDLQVCV